MSGRGEVKRWTTGALIDAALTPCRHRSDVPCAGCEMSRRQELLIGELRTRTPGPR